jgi:hypothetical protein
VLLLVVLAVIATYVYALRFLTKKALRDVVALMRKEGATNPKGAKTLMELGLERKNVFDRMFSRRDFRPGALRMLAQANIVRAIEGDRVYLSEDELEHSPVKQFARIE